MKTFKDVPIDSDTKIRRQEEILVEEVPALYQKWV